MLTKFFEFFKGQGYQENIDMFSFPYDWRKDLRFAAKGLAAKVKQIVGDPPMKKVILIAYSLGAVVALYFLTDKNNHNFVDKLILLAPPLHGCPKYVGTLMFGKNFPPWGFRKISPVGGWDVEFMKKLVRNMPALYQFALEEWYETHVGGVIKDAIAGTTIKFTDLASKFPGEYNDALIKNSLAFRNELNRAWQSHAFAETYILTGSSINTITEIILENGRLKEQRETPKGDETVPSISLENILPQISTKQLLQQSSYSKGTIKHFQPNDARRLIIFENMSHGDIVQDQTVLGEVMKIIRSPSIIPVPIILGQLDPWVLRNRTQGGGGPLTTGDSRKEVKVVQDMLLALGYNIGPAGATGIFDNNTVLAVRKYQGSQSPQDSKPHLDFNSNPLGVDGLVGPLTADALNRSLVGRWYNTYETPDKVKKNYNEIKTGKKVILN